jgi:two-component system response regulator (stage 0 sporulation protein F)
MNSCKSVASAVIVRLSHVMLIIEDDPDMRRMLVTLVEDEGIAAVAIDSGFAAVEWLQAHRPAMVILSRELSSDTDDDMLQELCCPTSGAIPVITLASVPQSVHILHACGVWTHVATPFTVIDLLHAVHAYL